MDLYSLDELHMLRDPVTQTKCVVGWSADTLVVAFRGTANCQNATHDMKVSICIHLIQKHVLWCLLLFAFVAVAENVLRQMHQRVP